MTTRHPKQPSLSRIALVTLLLSTLSSWAFAKGKVANPQGTAIPVLDNVISKLEIIDIVTGNRNVIYQEPNHFEAPNWSRDGEYILFNKSGRLYKLNIVEQQAQVIDTGNRVNNNNDHGLSPDGNYIAISDQTFGDSTIAVLPAQGGEPKQVTTNNPSYWHGWSPDGQSLAYCGERNGNYDIYVIPARGGEEKRLTSTPGLDDGPDYAPRRHYLL